MGGGKGGGNKRWSLRYTFDATPTKVHFALPETFYTDLDGNGEFPFRIGERYFAKFGGQSRKGAYIEVNPEQDVVAAYQNPQALGLEDIDPIPEFNKIKHGLYYSVAGWIEEWFHLVKVENRNNDGTHLERLRCTGRGCKHCKAGDPKVFGKQFFTTIAPSHWDAIHAANEDVANSCRCGGFTFVEKYVCANCEDLLVDVAMKCESCGSDEVGIDPEEAMAVCQQCETEWSVLTKDNPDIVKLVNSDVTCQGCRHTGIPIPVMTCTNCDTPNPYGIFDCQVVLHKSGEGKQSELHVDSFTIQEPDPKLFDPEYQGPDKEKAEKYCEWARKPIDLNEIFAPESADRQAELLHVPNPFSSKNPTKGGFASYSRNQDDDDEAEEEVNTEEEHEEEMPSKVARSGRGGVRRRR